MGTNIFCRIFKKNEDGEENTAVNYVLENADVLDLIVNGYAESEIALNCGSMLRACLAHESISRYMITSEEFYKLFDYVELPNFEIVSDTFASIKSVLTEHKSIAAEFILENYDDFVSRYNSMVKSKIYVVSRQCLKI